jgi:hypothetical protein
MENLNRTFGTRLFKGEDGSIIFVNEKDIETEYNNGDFSLRADELLKYRDDNYSRKAILAAYLKKSKN